MREAPAISVLEQLNQLAHRVFGRHGDGTEELALGIEHDESRNWRGLVALLELVRVGSSDDDPGGILGSFDGQAIVDDF